MSVSIFLVRTIVDAADRAGASLRSRFAFDWGLLDQPEARIDFAAFAALVAAAVEATSDESLGLHISEQMTEGAADVLAHMAAHAPTMREAVQTVSAFVELAMNDLGLFGEDEGDVFVVRFVLPRFTPQVDRLLAEFMLGGQIRLAKVFTGPAAAPRYTCFAHARPADDSECRRLFGSEVRFGQDRTCIAFDRDIVDRTQLHRHSELLDLLRLEAQRRLNRMGTGAGVAGRLRQYLLTLPVSRMPDVSTAARALGMSDRSLRRHLATDGTSYRDAVRTALEESAGRMLRDCTRTIKETSSALGFADATAFHRAFKRWTGFTPGEYRRAHGSE
jgi:AraC-like DNA-binding protein